MGELAKKTLKGVFWSSVERFSLQSVQFAIGIVLARILFPSDYGLIGMLAVFLGVSQIIIDCGISSALIRQKDVSEKDYGTAFVVNVAISFVVYGVLFLIAPFVASFFEISELASLLRVLSITLVINAFYGVQQTKLNKKVDFKTLTKCTFISATLSGVFGIYLALHGFGVWSLAYQGVVNSVLMFLCISMAIKWIPRPCIDKTAFKRLFGFGSKILISSLIHTIYFNLYNVVVGKLFLAKQLGFYSKAEQISLTPSTNVVGILSRVAYPILSDLQDDCERFKSAYTKFLKLSCFAIFPLMTGLCALANPAINLLFGEKWMGAALFLQILCVGYMFEPVSEINLKVLYVKGRSDLVLKLEIIKKIIAVLILVASIPFGIVGICAGRAFYCVLGTFLNMAYTRRFVGISIYEQVKMFFPYLVLSLFMGALVYFVSQLDAHCFVRTLVGVVSGVIVYFGVAFFLKLDALQIIRSYLNRK